MQIYLIGTTYYLINFDYYISVVISARSPGCRRLNIATIVINGAPILQEKNAEGILIITIPPNRLTGFKFENINSKVISIESKLENHLKAQLKERGTLLVIATKLHCHNSLFDGWYDVVKNINGLQIGDTKWLPEFSAALIIGCYKECPDFINGTTIPFVEFGGNYDVINVNDIKIGYNSK